MNTQRIEQNGFRLVEVVDDTSRTVVWKAVQNTLDRTVIIRVLKPDATANPTEVDHFLSIARLVARIKSESIAAVFDIVSEGDLHYVVMEHVEGPTLEEVIASHGPLSTDKILRIAASLITSLDLMWQTAHLVHRNLKSSTIRLDNRGVAKITDFSLAIAAGPRVDATALDGGHIVGTPCFLSPEQAQGSHLLNTQSDMYALGVVLYHLATGVVPFEDRDVVSILAGHIKHQIPPPHLLSRHIPVNFSWFLHRLMMKNPNNRYQDWEHVIHDIRHILADELPTCVHPEEEFLSTIDMGVASETGAQDSAVPHTPRVRLRRKNKSSGIGSEETSQVSQLIRSHVKEIRRDDLIRGIVCWTLLACWLSLVFWFRAIYQGKPAQTDTAVPLMQGEDITVSQPTDIDTPETPPVSAAKEQAPPPVKAPAQQAASPAKPPEPPASAASPAAEAPKPQTAPDILPAGVPPTIVQGLAKAFANSDLTAARQCVKAATERFQEKEALMSLLNEAADPATAVAEYLKTQIGKPLLFEHKGKQRTVIPRSVVNGVIQLESNGLGAEFPIDRLSADEKLRWMSKPRDAASCVAYCMVLLRSSHRDELQAQAAECPLLAEAFTQAVSLVPAVTPPAE